jgi:SAM-dependent methyltransferase
MYASPQLSLDVLETVNEINTGEPGNSASAEDGVPKQEYVRLEERMVTESALNLVGRFLDPRDKSFLDLRCRSGALSGALKARGARVISVDPFDANIDYARRVRGLSNVFRMPFSSFHHLQLPQECEFDAVTVLTEHVLAHVLSPSILLRRIFDLLRPGGYLFLDEKDVLRPTASCTYFVLDTGLPHQYHLTLNTIVRYVSLAGFDVVECSMDAERISDFRHVRVVARKPEAGASLGARRVPAAGRAESAATVRRRLRRLSARLTVRRGMRRVLAFGAATP